MGNNGYIIVLIIVFVILLAVLKITSKDSKINFNKLVEYLGGIENIIDYTFSMSRFTVTLNDVNLANKEGLSKLGARGIVEINNQLKIILGPESGQLKKYIDELKKNA